MSRTLTAAMTGHLAGRSHTRATMLRLDLRDGTSIGITDHDRDLDFDLGDGSITYSARTGILPSDIQLSVGLEADNFEVSGPIGETISQEQLLGGRVDYARARLFQVNHKNLAAGAVKLLAGNVSNAEQQGGKFVLSITSDAAKFNQPVGGIITNRCNADYGDTRCGATPVSITATVTAVTTEVAFTVSYSGDYADEYFNLGTVEALTGSLAGTLPMEVFSWDQSVAGAASLVLFAPLAEAPAVGDTFTVKRGCARTRAACMERNNILNFRGYPEVPGSDLTLRPAIPGQGN